MVLGERQNTKLRKYYQKKDANAGTQKMPQTNLELFIRMGNMKAGAHGRE